MWAAGNHAAAEYLLNWLAWLVVNIVSVGLFAFKGLWLTVLLYILFAVLSVIGAGQEPSDTG